MGKAVERIYPSKWEMQEISRTMRMFEHMKRYNLIKRYCYGTVVDIACGTGYGTFLLSNNPDVKELYGFDINEEAIEYARKEFQHPKIEFEVGNTDSFIGNLEEIPVDTLVSLETIEHLSNPTLFAHNVSILAPSILVVSFPDKKSTHFNPHHLHDFSTQDIINLFCNSHILVREFSINDVTILIFVSAPYQMPKHIFKNVIK